MLHDEDYLKIIWQENIERAQRLRNERGCGCSWLGGDIFSFCLFVRLSSFLWLCLLFYLSFGWMHLYFLVSFYVSFVHNGLYPFHFGIVVGIYSDEKTWSFFEWKLHILRKFLYNVVLVADAISECKCSVKKKLYSFTEMIILSCNNVNRLVNYNYEVFCLFDPNLIFLNNCEYLVCGSAVLASYVYTYH